MRRSKPEDMTNLMKLFVKEFKLEQGLMENRAVNLWGEILGTNVDRATVSKRLYNRKLYVQLSSSVVRQELFMIRTQIVVEMNRRLGRDMLDEIILK